VCTQVGILEAIHWKPAISWVIDRIHVLEGGRVVEAGSHDELVRRGGLYARLAQQQSLDGPSPAGTPEPAPA
jgi:ABC-type transport system involved in cytochrome bd biosynthesis fused ATPase/permease subunit